MTFSESKNRRFLRRCLAGASIVTAILSAYITHSFSAHCRDLQCLGLIFFYSGFFSSFLGLLPSLCVLPFVKEMTFQNKPFVRIGFVVIACLSLVFSWFVLLAGCADLIG